MSKSFVHLHVHAGGSALDGLANVKDLVQAVHILTHEAQHLKGETNEAIAECDALQADAAVAQPFGATIEQCRQYGQMDRTPTDGIWP